MILYLIKVILGSAVFILTFKLLLEKEKIHRFNRAYLLLSLLIPFVIPSITFHSATPITTISNNEIVQSNFLVNQPISPVITDTESTDYAFIILLTMYALVSGVLLFRFVINLYRILIKVRLSETLEENQLTIVLINEEINPYSFLKYLFVNQKMFKNGAIEKEILIHEYAHIMQKHSFDILFVELLQVFFWFNPFMYLYKKAIQLNHEFLADEAVINACANVTNYQYLLIEKASKSQAFHLSSSFNFLITKQRLIMMTKTKSPLNAFCRQMALIPVLALTVFALSTQSLAQAPTSSVPTAKQKLAPAKSEGASQALMDEYAKIVDSKKNKNGTILIYKFTDAEREKLQSIFLAMNKEQQAKQILTFVPNLPPFEKSEPTQEQIEAWKNSKIYGVWIDDKRVSNSALNQYNNTDFSLFLVSKLEKNAYNYGKHYYQINLMTHTGYAKYYKETTEGRNKYFMSVYIGRKPNEKAK